VLTQNKQTQS